MTSRLAARIAPRDGRGGGATCALASAGNKRHKHRAHGKERPVITVILYPFGLKSAAVIQLADAPSQSVDEVLFWSMTRRLIFVAAFTVAASVAMVGAQTRQYRTRLSPVALDVAMQAAIAGSGSVTATLNGTTLTLTGNYTGLRTASTVARVHRSPRTAMRGPAIGDLKITPGTSGTISGTLELTKDQVDDLANGRIYIQLHSEKAPDGNLWGWLFIQEGKK